MQARAGPRESFQWAGHKIGRFVQIAFKEPIISQFMIEIESVMNKFIRKKISADTKSHARHRKIVQDFINIAEDIKFLAEKYVSRTLETCPETSYIQ